MIAPVLRGDPVAYEAHAAEGGETECLEFAAAQFKQQHNVTAAGNSVRLVR